MSNDYTGEQYDAWKTDEPDYDLDGPGLYLVKYSYEVNKCFYVEANDAEHASDLILEKFNNEVDLEPDEIYEEFESEEVSRVCDICY